jgi:large subunit ribosomal protein L25
MSKLDRVTHLTIHTRTSVGTTAAKAVRREGQVPGVLYGHGASVSIAIDAKALSQLLNAGGKSHIVDATIDGVHDSVLLREVQRDPISRRPIAADFQRVSLTEEIYASVGIVAVGVAPGIRDQGGVLDIVTHELEIKGPAGKLPEHLEVDISALSVGDHINADAVPLPAGFVLITPGEKTVVSLEGARANVGDGSPEAEAEAAGLAAAPASAAADEPAGS